jgi:hypothetical protein
LEAPIKRTWRLGPRERQRLQTVLVLVVLALLWFIAFQPWLKGVIATRDLQTCQTNCLKIGQALTRYMQDWDDAFPPADTWMTNAAGMLGTTSGTGFGVSHYFHCPTDHSGAPSSYAYNDLLQGISPGIQSKDPQKEARRNLVRVPARFPMVIEKHGTAENGHLTLKNWADVDRAMDTPHLVPDPTGMLIDGAGQAERKTREQLRFLSDKRF